MLGPGIVLLGVPTAMIVSMLAFSRGTDRPFAIAALVLSALEGLLLATVLALSFVFD